MNFFKELELIIEAKSPKEKIDRFNTFYKQFQGNEFAYDIAFQAKKFTEPSYNKICKTVPPQDVPKRSNLTAKEGQINLLHAIAHIEYSAIDLALDAAYRFQNMPEEYYADWLKVAEDEIRHFLLLEKLLQELSAEYGDIPVHDALFEASQKTQTLLERMAVVPRYLEANGLDATPMILTKLRKLPSSEILKKIITTLELILDEEIDHVQKGDVWFKMACVRENMDESVYFDIIKKYYPRSFLRPDNLNIVARKEAGFSCNELNRMSKKTLC